MRHFTATETKNRFGEMLEFAALQPVVIEKNGREVAVLLSKAEYDRLVIKPSRSDLIKSLHKESMQRFGSVYEALAK